MSASTPAKAGPTVWELATVSWVSEMALDKSSRSTTSPVMAIRAGPMNANDEPWMTDATKSIQNCSRPNTTMIPSQRALRDSETWAPTMSARRGKRSAATPPNGVTVTMPMPKAKSTKAKLELLSVSWMANQPRARICMPTARNATSPDHHSRAYSRLDNDANIPPAEAGAASLTLRRYWPSASDAALAALLP